MPGFTASKAWKMIITLDKEIIFMKSLYIGSEQQRFCSYCTSGATTSSLVEYALRNFLVTRLYRCCFSYLYYCSKKNIDLSLLLPQYLTCTSIVPDSGQIHLTARKRTSGFATSLGTHLESC